MIATGSRVKKTIQQVRPQCFLRMLFMAPLMIACSIDSSSINKEPSEDSSTFAAAKNIILLIGDGMGPEQRKAARWVAGQLSMDDMPVSGFIKTHSADELITDSAAAATAMASGVKTNNNVVGLRADLSVAETILEFAQSKGKSVGLVSTTQITHATPASFAAHVKHRRQMSDIADQIFDAKPDVLLGGGENYFLPASERGCHEQAGRRDDKVNLIEIFVAQGYRHVCDEASLRELDASTGGKVIGLFADEEMRRPYGPSLAMMTERAIELLSKTPNGFFLMVEGGQIDWASHDNDAANTIQDTILFDHAVDVAKQYAAGEQNTLVIVVADHETGGMTLSTVATDHKDEDGPFKATDGRVFYVTWTTNGHTNIDVPITSLGPNSQYLTGIHDNTDIYRVMMGSFQAARN